MLSRRPMSQNPTRSTRPLDLASDLDRVGEIMAAAFPEELARRRTTVSALTRPLRLAMPFLRIAARMSLYVKHRMTGAVSLEGDSIASVVLMKPMGHDTSRWYIGPIATDPDLRRKGHGSAALRCAIALARTHGARFCLLDVRTDNDAAIGLYEGLGFRRYDGWDLLEAAPGPAADGPLLSDGYRIVRCPARWHRVRFRIAVDEVSQEHIALDPPSPDEFRIGLLERAIVRVQLRAAGTQMTRRLVEYRGKPVGWFGVRRNRTGQHTFTVHVARSHAEALADPLVGLALERLAAGPALPIQTRVGWGTPEALAACKRRGFRLVESNVRLGLDVSDRVSEDDCALRKP